MGHGGGRGSVRNDVKIEDFVMTSFLNVTIGQFRDKGLQERSEYDTIRSIHLPVALQLPRNLNLITTWSGN